MEQENMIQTVETDIAADDLLTAIAKYEAEIKDAEQQRDAFVAHYQAKIGAAMELCDDKTKNARAEIAMLTEELERYAQTQVTDKRRSVKLPSGTLSFRKQEPRFFFDDLKEANAQDERLIHFVKHSAYSYLKVKTEEAVDWAKFKRQLVIDDDGDVSFAETGEIIEGLRAQRLPDKFTVKIR